MVVHPDDLVLVNRRLPPIPGSVLRVYQKARNTDFGIVPRILGDPLHMGHNFADEGIALIRSFGSQEDHDLGNRYRDGVLAGIDGERVEEGVGGRGM